MLDSLDLLIQQECSNVAIVCETLSYLANQVKMDDIILMGNSYLEIACGYLQF